MSARSTYAPARTVELEAIAEGAADGPPWTFSGIAVAAGDVLTMDDGTRVLFTEEELRKAADTQAEEPLTADHPEDEQGRPEYPPPTDETVGRVQKAGWLASAQGVGYEAATHDEELARGIQAGSYDVSVHPTFELAERDPETGALLATDINFRDLSVVSKGDSPSNTAEWGPNQALASLTASIDIGAELTAAAELTVENDRESVIETLAEEHDFDEETLEAMSDDDLEQLADDYNIGASAEGPRTLSEMTVEEFADALKEQEGFLTEEEFKAELLNEIQDGDDDAETTGGLSPEEAERFEAHGTGVDENAPGAIGASGDPSPHVEQVLARLNESDGVDDYDSGVQDHPGISPAEGGDWDDRHEKLAAAAEDVETINQFAMAIGEPVDQAQRLVARYGLGAELEENIDVYGKGVQEDD